MGILLRLGWLNLRRRKLRSWLTGLMFFLGTFLLVAMVGLAEGAYGEMEEIGTQTFIGDFQILEATYDAKPTLFKRIEDYAPLREQLLADRRVEAVSPRLEAPGLLSKENATVGAMVVGLDPALEFASIMDTLASGDWWSRVDEEIPIVLGQGLAKRLKAGLGDEITYVGQAADGSIAAELFTVGGIMGSGMDDLDRSLAFVPLAAAQELLVLEGGAHRLVGKATDKRVLAGLQAETTLPDDLVLMRWDELAPELARTIATDRAGLYVFLLILMAVVLLGVANTMMMSVMERTHELGVIQALGTTPRGMVLLVLAEIFWIGVLGIGTGTLLGGLFNWIAGMTGIPSGVGDFDYGGVSLATYHPINTVQGTLLFPLAVLASGLIAGLLPALRAALANPADAMRD